MQQVQNLLEVGLVPTVGGKAVVGVVVAPVVRERAVAVVAVVRPVVPPAAPVLVPEVVVHILAQHAVLRTHLRAEHILLARRRNNAVAVIALLQTADALGEPWRLWNQLCQQNQQSLKKMILIIELKK